MEMSPLSNQSIWTGCLNLVDYRKVSIAPRLSLSLLLSLRKKNEIEDRFPVQFLELVVNIRLGHNVREQRAKDQFDQLVYSNHQCNVTVGEALKHQWASHWVLTNKPTREAALPNLLLPLTSDLCILRKNK